MWRRNYAAADVYSDNILVLQEASCKRIFFIGRITGEYHNDPSTHVARLHGWAKTDSQGGFAFHTIKPGAYPGRTIPAHIHFHAWGGGYPLQWTPDLNFAGDPLLKSSATSESAAAGKFGSVQQLSRGADGVLRCAFNVRLSPVTNYK